MSDVRNKLALATCALLSQHTLAQNVDNDWIVDSSYLNYSEADDRVEVHKLIASVKGKVSGEDEVSLQLVYDTMSGATPTGLVFNPAAVDTVTGVSGGGFSVGTGSATVAEFDDTRLAAKLDWTHQHTRTFSATYGTAISVENDYQSMGASVNFDKDTDSRLTTFSAGFAGTFDTISRTGGLTPVPLANFADPDSDVFVDAATRHTWEAIVGMTRVLNARTIAQFNLSFGQSLGYHTDPYKLVSIADDVEVPIPRGAIYESRPEERERRSIYGKVAHQNDDGNIWHVSYRHYEDDWEVSSDTIDLKYHLKLAQRSFVEPYFRYYMQSAAEFYTHFLDSAVHDAEDADTLPEFVSADYRLDAMDSVTVGFKYGTPLFTGGRLRFRAAYVLQTYDDSEFDEHDAIVLQLSFKNVFQ